MLFFPFTFDSTSNHLAEVFSQTFTESQKLSQLSVSIHLHPNVPTSRKKLEVAQSECKVTVLLEIRTEVNTQIFIVSKTLKKGIVAL